MRWRKLGRVFCPDNETEWMRSHASNPTPEPLGNGVFRIYFSTRNASNRSSIGWLDFDIRRPTEVARLCDAPVVSPGATGAFDDSGASMGCIVRIGEKRHLYYVGWNLGVTAPWRNSIGLAISEGRDAPFARYSTGPILDRSTIDPYSLSYPFVMPEGSIWRMWYGSNIEWGARADGMRHVIKYAESTDGLIWRCTGEIAIALAQGEIAVARPWVVNTAGRSRMWYCYRGTTYRIGYAESRDGRSWERRDALAGLGVSESGWDDQSVAYPSVFEHDGALYMLYNGNGYGRTGFGIAVLEHE